MKVALFGGSFNPIHKQHVNVVEEILRRNLVDEVWIIPCRFHNFKGEISSSDERVKMIELSFDDPRVKVCFEELNFSGKSYSHDTIMRLKEKFDHDFYWIIGSDILEDFDRWHKWENLLKIIKFILVKREGYPLIEIEGMKKIILDDFEENNISSTQVREKGNFEGLVLPKVGGYIKRRKLYSK